MTAPARAGLASYLFIAAGGLITLAAAWAWFIKPVDYQAYALLKVASAPPGVLGEGQASREDFAIFKRTQAQLITSNAVLGAALRDRATKGLSMVEAHGADAPAWLASRLSVDFPDDAEIMRVSITGPQPQELVKLLNKVVQSYLAEIVEHDKQQRIANEEKLRRAHEHQTTEYQKELQALRTLESIHKTSGSEEAQLKKRLATGELDRLLDQRAQIREEIRHLAVEIALAEQRAAAAAREVRTAKLAAEGAQPPALEELNRKMSVLQAQLKDAEQQVLTQTEKLASLETFSAQVAAKQEEVAALKAIKDRVGAQLDLAMIERLAPERITKVDDAVVADNRGDVLRRNMILGALAAGGLVLVAVGVALRLGSKA